MTNALPPPKKLLEGQLGYMVLLPDGTIERSSGELSNCERAAKAILKLLKLPVRLNFDYGKKSSIKEDVPINPIPTIPSKEVVEAAGPASTSGTQQLGLALQPVPETLSTTPPPKRPTSIQEFKEKLSPKRFFFRKKNPVTTDADDDGHHKWHRITMDFGDFSYIACLSNKKIHILKKNSLYRFGSIERLDRSATASVSESSFQSSASGSTI